MPTFLRFPTGGDTLVNTEQIVSIQLEQHPAEQRDVDRASHLFRLGQMRYMVRLRLPDGNVIDLEYPVKASRDMVYEAIIAALQPTVINPFASEPSAPRSRRKPAARKPKP